MSQQSAGAQPPHHSYEQSAHPSAAGPGAKPPPPVRTAVRLMWVGAALALLNLLLLPLQTDTIRDQFADQPDVGIDPDTLVSTTIAAGVVLGLIAVGLWVLMALMNGKGKSWARITATVLGGLNILSLLASLSGAAGTALPPLALVLGVASLILAGVIVYLLWQRPASEWFDAMGRGSATSA